MENGETNNTTDEAHVLNMFGVDARLRGKNLVS